MSEATDEVLKELRQGDHGDPDLLNHLNKVLDENIHASGLLFKVHSRGVKNAIFVWKNWVVLCDVFCHL